MKKHLRIAMAAACAFAMVGAFALFGCSSTEQKADEPKADEPKAESHEAVELQLFAANSLSKAMDAVQALYVQTTTGSRSRTRSTCPRASSTSSWPAARTPTC